MGKQVWPLQNSGLIRCSNYPAVLKKTLASELADAFAKRLPAWLANRNPEIFLTPIADILRRA
jgi:hypothetical protein